MSWAASVKTSATKRRKRTTEANGKVAGMGEPPGEEQRSSGILIPVIEQKLRVAAPPRRPAGRNAASSVLKPSRV
jgi:hypothetical protein